MTTIVNNRVVLGPYVVGEIPEAWIHQLLDDTGTAINLTGYTVLAKLRKPDGTFATRAGTIHDAAAGKVRVPFASTDLDQAGVVKGVLWVGNAGSFRPATRFAVHLRAADGGPAPTI